MSPPSCAHAGDLGLDLRRDLGRVGRPGAEHELRARIELQGGVERVRDALLARDPPHEHDEGPSGSMPWRSEGVRARVGPVALRVDAVVDDAHARGVDGRIAGEDVARLLARDRDDRVGGLQRGALAEARDGVAAAELLLLPRPHRLEAVHGRDVRDPVQQLREVAAEIRVPGVAVRRSRSPRRPRPSRGRSRPPRAPPRAPRGPRAPPTAGRPARPGRPGRPRARRPSSARSDRRDAPARARGTRRARPRRRRPRAGTPA